MVEPIIQPIQTRYNGYHFRSRLEARWAVFFDTLGIRYEYEPDAFQVHPGLCYLPDFWLPELDCFFEVKGKPPSSEEIEKAERLMIITGKKVFLFHGSIQGEWDDHPILSTRGIAFYMDYTKRPNHYATYWLQCPKCLCVSMTFTNDCKCWNNDVHLGCFSEFYNSPLLLRALRQSRGHRFEPSQPTP